MRHLQNTFLIVLFSVSCLLAQTDSLQRSDRYYNEGLEAYNFSHNKEAIALFKKAVTANPQNAKAHLMAGKSILLTVGKRPAIEHFRQAYKLDPDIDEDIFFLLGQAYHYNESFDSALLYYDLMNQSLSKSLRFSRVMKMSEVNWKIFECRNAKVFKANPVSVIITHLNDNINSEYPDYAPTITADESVMIYTTRRPESNQSASDEPVGEYFEEIFSSKSVNGVWQPASNVQEINSAFHDASVSLSPDGKEMFVYGDENGGDLYETDLQSDGKWSRPNRLNGFVNSPYSEHSAAVTAKNDRLFFVSDRPEGYGGTDIYVAKKNKRGEWSQVENLGSQINTESDEVDVFISANGRHLYFSSNGHSGMGDLDIYRSEYDSAKNEWSEALNLGYPINSVENDIYFVMNGDERYGYFSSVRSDSKGDEDIYKVDLKEWKPVRRETLAKAEQALINQTAVATMSENTRIECGIQLKDEETKLPLDGTITVSVDQTAVVLEKVGEGSYRSIVNAPKAKEYQIKISVTGYQSALLAVQNENQTKLSQTVFLKKDNLGTTDETNSFSLFYGVDKAVPQHQGVVDLVAMKMKEDANCVVVISSYTDNTGEEVYNLSLSQQRAEEAKNYLLKAGVEASRIQVLALGESKPEGDNATTMGRRVNRRTDLVIKKK